MNPIKAPTPIQYQRASWKIPRDFNTNIPNGSVSFGGIYILTHIFFQKHGLDNNILYLLIYICFLVEFKELNMLTCLQFSPRNSFTAIAFCAYIMGETQ